MLGPLKEIVMHRNRLASFLCALGAWVAVSGHAASPPTAVSDTYSVSEDTRLSINRSGVLTNDFDPDGTSLTALLISAPPNGTLAFTNNGGFAYTPRTNFFGTDSFTYRARDTGGATSALATVTITVNPVNDAPRATNNFFSLNADTTFQTGAGALLANDFDVEGSALTTVLASNVTRGVLVLNSDGSFSYTPNAGFFGTDLFTYRAHDGATNSATATVTLNVIPAPIVITTPPASQAVCAGATVSFSVAATGTALTYQWFKSTNLLAGATNSALLLNNVGASDAAPYRVRLTGATNSVTNSATLAVNLPVSTPPLANQIRMVGSIVAFNATATGTAPITYSWLKNGEVILGQSGGTLLLSNLLTTDSGQRLGHHKTPAHRSSQEHRVLLNPCFNQFDVMLVIDRSGSMVGQAYTDARTAASNFVHNLHLSTETNDTLGLVSYNPTSTLNQTLTNSPLAMEEAIQALGPATNGTCISCGIITAQAELTSARRRPNALPVLVLLTDGIPHDFDTPSNALYNAQLAKNAGTRVFTIAFGTNIDSAMMTGMASSASDYFYASNSAQLGALFDAISTTICRPPTNIFGPYGTTVCAGATVNLEVNASGCAKFNFQWRKDGFALPGRTNATLVLNNTVVTDSGDYSVIVSSVCRTVTNHAAVVVNAPAQVVTPAANQASYLGSNVVFSVTASGTRLSYEWSFNGTVLGTNSALALDNLTAGQAGEYCVVISSVDCGGPVTNCATLTILNRAPTATADAYTTAEDTTLTVPAAGILANDSDVDGDALTVTLASGVANGILNLSADGAFTYTPSLNHTGTVTFTYTVADGLAVSAPATVTITITPANDAPVAADDSYTTVEDTVLTVPAPGLLANDSDADGDVLSAVLVDGVSHGSLEMSAAGSFLYTPSLNFTGLATFTYRVTDGTAQSAPATVRITVTPVNDAPVAVADEFTTLEDTLLTIPVAGILTNDFDVDGDALSAVLIREVANGTLVLSTDGSFTYLPNANFHGEDSFLYRASDGALHSETTLVRIIVIATNDAPIAVNDAYATAEDIAINVPAPGVLPNDTDADGDPLTAQLVGNVAHGTLVLNADGSFNYTPNGNYHGVDSFTYQITDSFATSAVATVSLTISSVNDQPLGVAGENDNYTTPEDQSLGVAALGVLANDSDPDGDALTAVLVSGVSHGTLALLADGSFSYAPAANYFGPDSFTYVANDGLTNSAPVVVALTVTPVNDTPSFNAGSSQRVNFNVGAQTVANWASSLSAGPANESAQAVHFELANNNPALFAVQPAVNAAGALSYTPVGTGYGVATLTVVLKDSGGTANGGSDTSVEKTFSITLNGPPIISIINPSNSTSLVGTNNITVIAQASDPDSVITNVTIFDGTNVLSSGTNTPYFASLLNAAFGTHAFRAEAVDDLGLRATSSIVTVTVTQTPPVTALGPILLNHQNGLFEQFVRIANPTPQSFPNGVRLIIKGLDTTNRVYNATGTNGGFPCIEVLTPLPSQGYLDVLVQYYVPNPRTVPNPQLVAEPRPFTVPVAGAPTLVLAGAATNALTLRFATVVGRLYYLQSSEDFVTWIAVPGLIQGTGGVIQCTPELGAGKKFFRVLLLP